MSDYTDAPATAMLATCCACCGRPLVDAKSVETGVGPICRKKYGFDADVTEEARVAANALVYKIALKVSESAVTVEVLEWANELRTLGFEKIAAIVEKRSARIQIRVEDGRYFVRVPYSPEFNDASKVQGRRGTKEGKVFWWTFPQSKQARKALWTALQETFPGTLGVGPKGPFVVKAVA
jgi:hypothetical protein